MRGLLLTRPLSAGCFCFKYLVFVWLDVSNRADVGKNMKNASLVLQGGKRKGGKGASVSLFLCGDVEEIFR